MLNQQMLNELESELQNLVGEECDKIGWLTPMLPPDDPNFNKPYITSRIGNNDTLYRPGLYFYFGRKRIFTGVDWFTLAPFGTWHILRRGQSLCSYVGAYDRDNNLVQNLKIIYRNPVRQVIFIRDKLNLFLEFDDHYWLGIFHTVGRVSGFQFGISRSIDSRGGSGTDWQIINGNIFQSGWIS